MTSCCCPPNVTPGPTPNNPVGPLAEPIDFDPTVVPTPSLAGIDVSTLTAAELAVSGREDGTVRTADITVSSATGGDTIGGTVAGQAFVPVAATPGDDDATATALAAALDALTNVSSSATGAVVSLSISGLASVGIDVSVTGAGGTALAIEADAETCRLRIFREREGAGGQLDGWQVMGSYGGGPRADYAAPFEIGEGFAPIVLQLAGVTALYPYTSDLAGDDDDVAGITYRAYATLYPLE